MGAGVNLGIVELTGCHVAGLAVVDEYAFAVGADIHLLCARDGAQFAYGIGVGRGRDLLEIVRTGFEAVKATQFATCIDLAVGAQAQAGKAFDVVADGEEFDVALVVESIHAGIELDDPNVACIVLTAAVAHGGMGRERIGHGMGLSFVVDVDGEGNVAGGHEVTIRQLAKVADVARTNVLGRIENQGGEVVGLGTIHLHTRQCADQDSSFIVGTKGANEIVLQGIGIGGVVTVGDELRPVETAEAVFGGYPNGFVGTLLDLVDQTVGQIVVGREEQIEVCP